MNSQLSDESKLTTYEAQYDSWLLTLQDYHSRFDRNYKQYTAYSQLKGTKSKISDPVAPELVEKVIQKMFEREPRFIAIPRGADNIPREVSRVVSAVVEYYWSCPERIQSTGTMRSKLKVAGREFCVTGNTGVETFYNPESETPDTRVIPIEDVVFDPTKTLKTSEVIYVRQSVDLNYLESRAEVVDDKGNVVTGIFKHIKELKVWLGDRKDSPDDPRGITIDRHGSAKVQTPVGPLELVSRFEGKKVCRFIKGFNKILQEYENEVLGEDPLDFAMDIEVPKIPYAFSFLDFINGLTQAKDLFLQQSVDYGAKLLNPPLFVDPNIAPVNRPTLANAYKVGGIVFASPQQAGHQPMPPYPQSGFELLNYMQSRSESVSGIGAYLSGVPNQVSDKTQGTKGGILALMEQSVSPVKDRQINIEESIIEPMVNKWLKYAGALLGKDEVKDIVITGEGQQTIRVTKGLLTGKITIADLLTLGVLEQEEANEISLELMMLGKDPNKEIVFDVDWLVRVETGSMAEVNNETELQNFERWVGFARDLGQPLELKKVLEEHAARANVKEPEQYFAETPMTPPMTPPGMNGVPQGMPEAAPMPEMASMGAV